MLYNHLTAEERGMIEAWLFEGLSASEIGRRLGRHRSTITREIKRNSETRRTNSIARIPYRATNANNLATLRRKNCGTTNKSTPRLLTTIQKYLNLKYSPEQISFGVSEVFELKILS